MSVPYQLHSETSKAAAVGAAMRAQGRPPGQRTGLSPNTVRPRLVELRRGGHVRPIERTRANASGWEATVYILGKEPHPPQGRGHRHDRKCPHCDDLYRQGYREGLAEKTPPGATPRML